MEAVFNYFAQDAFYYFAVARNSTTSFYSFDGETATNGFHPLWQFYLTYVFSAIGSANQTVQLYAAFVLSCIMTTVGYMLCGMAAYRVTKLKAVSILVVPGLYYLIFSFVTNFYGSPWQWMNGMESGLTVFFGGVLFCLLAAHYNDPHKFETKGSFFLILGTVVSVMILSRLDDVFLLFSLGLCIFVMGRNGLERWIRTYLLFTLPTVVLLTLYVIFNYTSTGFVLPVSGMAKSTFALVHNVRLLMGTLDLQPVIPGGDPGGLWLMTYYRYVQLLFPAVACLLFGSLLWGERTESRSGFRDIFLIGLLLYVVLKAAYNFTMVRMEDQGFSWYYVFSLMVTNFAAVVIVQRKLKLSGGFSRLSLVLASCVVVMILLSHLVFVTRHGLQTGNPFYRFWHDRKSISAYLSNRIEHPRLVEYDDGIIGYSLGFPTIHGFGFVADYEGYRAKRRGEFLHYCRLRGFNVIASVQYIVLNSRDVSSDAIRESLRRLVWFQGEDLDRYDFELLLRNEQTGACFVAFRPKHLLEL